MKDKILTRIEDMIECFVSFNQYIVPDLSEIEQGKMRRIATILEEAKINCENDRYFSIPDVLKMFNINNKYLNTDINNLRIEVDKYFHNILVDYLHQEPNYKNVWNIDIENYAKRLASYPSLYEEAINIILNGIDNIEELVTTEGYTVKDYMSFTRLPFISCYPFHIELMEDSVLKNEVMEILSGF